MEYVILRFIGGEVDERLTRAGVNPMIFFYENIAPTLKPTLDVFDIMFTWLWDAGMATVCSAGNEELFDTSAEQRDLSARVPRGKGGADTPLIVVGNNRFDNSRYPTSQFRDAKNLGILTLYNVGTDVDCATIATDPDTGVYDPAVTNQYGIEPAGTSQATAITAGMIAYFMSQPALSTRFNVNGLGGRALAIKRYLQFTANKYKFDAGVDDGIPRAALGDVVPCTGGTAGNPTVLTPFDPPAGFPRTLATTQVTNGQTVVIDPVVSR